MEAVNNNNFYLFLEGKTDLVEFERGNHYLWKYVGLDPTYAEAYVIAIDLISHRVRSLHKNSIMAQSQECPHFFINATRKDVYRKKIEYHEKCIKNLEEFIEKED